MHRSDSTLRIVMLGLALVAMIVVFTGCRKPPEIAPPEIPPEEPMVEEGPTGEPYKIGAVFSITGPAAPLGVPERDTAEMLEEQINAAGGINGRPVEIIIRDTKGEETEALNAVKELIENEKVLAVVGPSRTGTSLAIIDYMEKSETPLISCAAAVAITTPVKKWVFKTPQTDADAVTKIYDYFKKESITKTAALTCTDAFGKAGLEQLKEQAKDAGIAVVAEEAFGDKDTDMTSQLTKIKGTDAQAVVCWGIGAAPALIAKQMKQLQMTIPLIQSHGVANMKFIEVAGDASNGVVFPAGRLLVADQLPDADPQKETLLRYAEEFRAKYERDPDTFGGHAWDAVQLVVKGLQEAGDDKEGIRSTIENTKDFVGIGGIFNYSAEDHYGLSPAAFVMVTIEDGNWKLLPE